MGLRFLYFPNIYDQRLERALKNNSKFGNSCVPNTFFDTSFHVLAISNKDQKERKNLVQLFRVWCDNLVNDSLDRNLIFYFMSRPFLKEKRLFNFPKPGVTIWATTLLTTITTELALPSPAQRHF